MVKVCVKDFPKKNGYYIDGYLKENLDPMIKHIKDDWDFVLAISGGGQVRIGKSVLGMQTGYYWNSEINRLYGMNNTFTHWNYCWSGEELKEHGLKLANNPYSVLVYDEAGGDLQGKKILSKITKNILDFFRECGQLNLFIIIILPDFFDLPKGMAIARSRCLIDVYSTGEFQRGFFRFFNWERKKKLYLKGKKEMNYYSVKPNFVGRFTNFYPIDEKEYRKAKKKSLENRDMEEEGSLLIKTRKRYYATMKLLLETKYFNQTEIARKITEMNGFPMDRKNIYDIAKSEVGSEGTIINNLNVDGEGKGKNDTNKRS